MWMHWIDVSQNRRNEALETEHFLRQKSDQKLQLALGDARNTYRCKPEQDLFKIPQTSDFPTVDAARNAVDKRMEVFQLLLPDDGTNDVLLNLPASILA